MTDWYETHLVGTGRAAAVWALAGFVVTFAIVRFITARIRGRANLAGEAPVSVVGQPGVETQDRRSLIGDVVIGGVHVHHQVWGILLVLVSGAFEFRFRPESPWLEVLAVMFGVGAALALDEFALWFYLDDVYWSDEGRKSIDAVLVGVAMSAGLLLSSSPLGLDDPDPQTQQSFVTVTFVLLTNLLFSVVCVLKGKLATGLIGLALPTVSFIGTCRLAKPTSWYAHKRYKGHKLERSQRRFGARWQARHDRLLDFLSGASRSGGVDETGATPRP